MKASKNRKWATWAALVAALLVGVLASAAFAQGRSGDRGGENRPSPARVDRAPSSSAAARSVESRPAPTLSRESRPAPSSVRESGRAPNISRAPSVSTPSVVRESRPATPTIVRESRPALTLPQSRPETPRSAPSVTRQPSQPSIGATRPSVIESRPSLERSAERPSLLNRSGPAPSAASALERLRAQADAPRTVPRIESPRPQSSGSPGGTAPRLSVPADRGPSASPPTLPRIESLPRPEPVIRGQGGAPSAADSARSIFERLRSGAAGGANVERQPSRTPALESRPSPVQPRVTAPQTPARPQQPSDGPSLTDRFRDLRERLPAASERSDAPQRSGAVPTLPERPQLERPSAARTTPAGPQGADPLGRGRPDGGPSIAPRLQERQDLSTVFGELRDRARERGPAAGGPPSGAGDAGRIAPGRGPSGEPPSIGLPQRGDGDRPALERPNIGRPSPDGLSPDRSAADRPTLDRPGLVRPRVITPGEQPAGAAGRGPGIGVDRREMLQELSRRGPAAATVEESREAIRGRWVERYGLPQEEAQRQVLETRARQLLDERRGGGRPGGGPLPNLPEDRLLEASRLRAAEIETRREMQQWRERGGRPGDLDYYRKGPGYERFVEHYTSGRYESLVRSSWGQKHQLHRQWEYYRHGDVARRLNLWHSWHHHGNYHDWWRRHRFYGSISSVYVNIHFGGVYLGPRWYPHRVWYPHWRPWVQWTWWDWCHPIYDPRPIFVRPIYYYPAPQLVVYEYPTWEPLPVVPSGTWVEAPKVVVPDEGLDLQLLAVRFVDPGHPERELGPRYRIWFRNTSATEIATPFNVVAVAANDHQLKAGLPEAGVRVESIAAGEIQAVDVRLPFDAVAMNVGADGSPAPFEYLHVIVDSHNEVPEVFEENNGAILSRLDILPVDPAAFATDVDTAAAGDMISIAGEGFGPEPGQVVVQVMGVELQAEIHGWYDLGARVQLPALTLASPTTATLVVVRGDGAAANPLEITMAPAGVAILPPPAP